jgi:hypothetical protein
MSTGLLGHGGTVDWSGRCNSCPGVAGPTRSRARTGAPCFDGGLVLPAWPVNSVDTPWSKTPPPAGANVRQCPRKAVDMPPAHPSSPLGPMGNLLPDVAVFGFRGHNVGGAPCAHASGAPDTRSGGRCLSYYPSWFGLKGRCCQPGPGARERASAVGRSTLSGSFIRRRPAREWPLQGRPFPLASGNPGPGPGWQNRPFRPKDSPGP